MRQAKCLKQTRVAIQHIHVQLGLFLVRAFVVKKTKHTNIHFGTSREKLNALTLE